LRVWRLEVVERSERGLKDQGEVHETKRVVEKSLYWVHPGVGEGVDKP
jgi:hypothetical protein